MGFSFRKRIKIAPGLNLNLGKKGLGISAGPKGAKISLGADGKTRLNAGKGMFRYSKTLGDSAPRQNSQVDPKMCLSCFLAVVVVIIVVVIMNAL